MTNTAIRNSFILNLILCMPEKIHIGAISVASKINNIEIPSIPSLKFIKPSIHIFSSTN